MIKKISRYIAGAALAATLVGVGFVVTDASLKVSAEQTGFTDIAETFEKTEYFTPDGITFGGTSGNNNEILTRYWINPWLENSNGVTFNAEFASSEWTGDFKIFYGASEVFASLENNILSFNVTNVLNGVNDTYVVENYDATAQHTWAISREYAQAEGGLSNNGTYGYTLKFELDGTTQWTFEENAQVAHNDYHYLIIRNETGSNVTIRSTIETAIEYEEEKNVLDIIEFNGNAKLYADNGLKIESSNLGPSTANWWKQPIDAMPVEVCWVKGFTSVSDGIVWNMRSAGQVATSYDVFKLEFGATDIRIAYNAESKRLSLYAYTKWSHSDSHKYTFGGEHPVAENFDFTEWHTYKVARVKATNANGYALRMYIDGEQRLELYCAGELANTVGDDSSVNEGYGFHAVRFVNLSGCDFYFKSTQERILPQAEVCNDILEYGGTLDLLNENGAVCINGESVLNTQWGFMEYNVSDYFAESNGIEFMFRTDTRWNIGADKLKIQLGATDIRLDMDSYGSLNCYCYDWANDYGVWGSRGTLVNNFDSTAWHTLKITRRKLKETSGNEGEKGMQITIYIDGVRVYERVCPTGAMYSYAYRRLLVGNTSGTDVYFKSLYDSSEFRFEEDNVSDLTDLYKQGYKQKYYEDAFSGYSIPVHGRIVDNLFQQEFNSISNGAEFILTSEEAWKTSGTAKRLVALSATELATLHTVEEDGNIFEKFTQDDGTEGVVASNGKDGLKYKLVDYDWSSDVARSPNGEIARDNWQFDSYWGDSYGKHYYSENNSDLVKEDDWFSFYYHMHVDFGTTMIGFKLTPSNNLFIRVCSTYTRVVYYEDYARDESGNPLVFKTGKYEGSGTETYFGKTLQTGDYYANKFQINRVRSANRVGFAVKIAINDVLVCNAYVNEIMGNSSWVHFLIDNLTGTELRAWSCKTFDEYKQDVIDTFNAFRANNYSTENRERLEQLIAENTQLVLNENSFAKMREYASKGVAILSEVYTVEQEQLFAQQKENMIAQLVAFTVNNTYSGDNLTSINALITEATAKINSITQTEGFSALKFWYGKYYKLACNVRSDAYEQQLAQEKNSAQSRLQSSYSAVMATPRITELMNRYSELIANTDSVGEPEMYALLFETELFALTVV